MKRWKALAFYATICVILCSSCKTTQTPLKDSDYYLNKNAIVFSSDHRVDDKENLRYSINSLIAQDENTSRLWPPKKWFSKDTLVVYDTQLAERSATSIEKFLRNKKGYYQANVKHNVGIEGDQITANYLIDVGPRYRVKSFEITSTDKALLDEIKNLKSLPLVEVGDPVDASLFESERSRITSDLQNLGYANFVPNFIQIVGDSSNYEVDVEFNIIVPPADSIHKKYYVGDINVYTEHLVGTDPIISKVESHPFGTYYSRSPEFIVKPKYLAKNIYLRTGELYQKQDRIKTQRTLNSLSTYKYAQVNRKLNPERDSIYDFDIYLSPYKHKWISDLGYELFYSAFGSTSIQQNLFGLSALASVQNRNLFGGSEKYTFSVDGSVELAIPSFAANRWSFNANNTLELPRLLDLFGTAKLWGKINLIPSDNYTPFEDEATTELGIGYNFTRSIQNFSISSFNASLGYTYRANNELLRKIRQLGFNLFIFNPTEQFIENNLRENELLANSFENNLSTGFLLRDLSYFYSGTKNNKGRSLGLIINLEQSGLEVFAANKIGNWIGGNSDVWKFGSFNFAKYIKLGLDGRYYKDLSQNGSSQLAARIDLGLAIPFGRQDNGDLLSTPYLSQFYVGGPNSLRGWQIRELGPGSFSTILEPPFFQAGDIKMEFNLEYRWDLFSYFKGAIFVDAGNIWTLREETGQRARAGSQFTSNFIDQIAVSSGWGVRADFTYFLIRIDFGYKVRSPFALDENGSHFVFGKKIPGTEESFNNLLGNINVAINYPF